MFNLVNIFVFSFCLYNFVASAQTVSNVRAEQEGSDIIILYELEAKEPCGIEVYVSPDGGRSWKGPLTNLSGDAGRNISAGAKKCRWAVLKEQDQFKGADVRFKVIATRAVTPFKTIYIGNQVWSSENLNAAQFANGDLIPEAKTDEEWQAMGEQGKAAWCHYNNDPANGAKYGKLYNWYAVADPRGLCPAGWHVPSDGEWTQLSNALGGDNDAGSKMKSASGWSDGGNGNNSSGFSGLPGGYRENNVGSPKDYENIVCNDYFIREAYERLGKEVRVSHILLKLPQDALPKDTLAVYNRIMKIRDMIAKGADISKIARDSSEDPSAKENSGDLGYFTGMQMVYPFETVAFNTKPGTVSMPVRTHFGFHIIKVIDVRPTQGEIHVAHIMVRTPKDESYSARIAAEDKIREALSALKAGMLWDTAVIKFSEDKGSVNKGGELPWFGTGRMVPEFEKAAFSLSKQGDISEIVKSMYGYHIIRLLDKRGIPPFDEKKAELKQMISRNSRNEASRHQSAGYWWSFSDQGSSYSWIRNLSYFNGNFNRYDYPQSYGFSVRCVKDNK